MTREEQIAVAFDDYSNSRKLSTFDDFEYIDIQVAFEEGAEWADTNPKSQWISVDDDLPYNHREYVDLKYNSYTCQMLVRCKNGKYSVERMVMIFGRWIWAESNDITHWMPIHKLPKE